MRIMAAALTMALCGIAGAAPGADSPASLRVEAKIPLGPVKGRIDHLAVDLARKRLYVAELGNDTVGVVDLEAGRLHATISGLQEPQGVAYLKDPDLLVVANGGDGSVSFFRGEDFGVVATVQLGEDADNVRVDPRTGMIVVGYGAGALAFIDPASRRVLGGAKLNAHPESFQIEPGGMRAFVNVPKAAQVAVVDMQRREQIAAWPVESASANFPMAIAPDGRVLIVTRQPPRLISLDPERGQVTAGVETCGDSDDLFFDAKRSRIYVSCGDGHVDIFGAAASGFSRLDRIPTSAGARTSLFLPELDRLFLAVRATSAEAEAIWVLRPAE
jgi:YVTN family beta-propeller protein